MGRRSQPGSYMESQHKAPEKMNNRCYECGQEGHFICDCPFMDSNYGHDWRRNHPQQLRRRSLVPLRLGGLLPPLIIRNVG
uniref:CCHC-type domain-containing protein n=1 Tax=Gopherus agassizii TaxID=38772 RepID=A0A452HSY6_9SAUR